MKSITYMKSVIFATSDDYLEYPTILMKMQIDTGDHKLIALEPIQKPSRAYELIR